MSYAQPHTHTQSSLDLGCEVLALCAVRPRLAVHEYKHALTGTCVEYISSCQQRRQALLELASECLCAFVMRTDEEVKPAVDGGLAQAADCVLGRLL